MAKVIGIGSALVDLVTQVSDEFLQHYIESSGTKKGGHRVLTEHEMVQLYQYFSDALIVPGGSAANTLSGLAQLGIETKMLGKVGDDVHGNYIIEVLESQGVDVSGILKSQTLHTGSCICMVTPDGERTMRTYLGASGDYDVCDLKASEFVPGSIVKVEGYWLNTRGFLKHCFELATANQCRILFDLASMEIVEKHRTRILELVKTYHPILFANQAEAFALTKTSTLDDALEKLRDLTSMVVITAGADGAYLAEGDEVVHVSARAVKAVDSTGAGDTFAVGFLYGLLNGWTLENTGNFACAAAAQVVQNYGGRLSEESWQNLRLEFLI